MVVEHLDNEQDYQGDGGRTFENVVDDPVCVKTELVGSVVRFWSQPGV